MNQSNILTCLLILISLSVNTYSQTILFSEDFESGETPLSWNYEFVKGAITWRYEPGGYSLTPSIPNTRQPMEAHGGNYNAIFQFQSIGNEATKLVTEKISALEFAIKPELHFYHAQMKWMHGGEYKNDKLKVYYKSRESNPWTLLRSYGEPTDEWTERVILLPEDDLSGDYYIAFEGETHWGWGTCVDDIKIIETGILQKYIAELVVEQASETSVASGTDQNPILRLKVKVMGNSGTLPLSSLILKSLNTDDADIKDAGVKLYHTISAGFNAENPIGSGVSFSGGQAEFTGLNFDLPTGYSYIWVAFDLKHTAGHRHILDAKFTANSINIKGNTYPSVEKSPAGSCTVFQTIYSEDFESENDWVLTGEFEKGSPQGLGGSQGNPDPTEAYSGNGIIGSDLTGLGEYEGDYEKNLYEDDDAAISDTMDLTYYNDLSLRYMRYLNIGVNDAAYIKVSPDGGKTWHTAWANQSMVLDDSWKLHEVNITPYAARKKKVLIKYSIGATNDYWQLSGWNIDDVTVTGSFVSKDVGISRIISPVQGCGNTSSESVTVVVKNYGANDSYGIIPLKYSIDGKKTFTLDTLHQVIPFGDSVIFTFYKKVDLSIPDIYNFSVTTSMSGDQDQSNDGIERSMIIQPTYKSDHVESFESKKGLWIAGGVNNSWQCGTPGFGIIPVSGTNVWKTKLLDNYPDRDSSIVESACYSNEDGKRKVLDLKYWVSSEKSFDGAILQYSTNNGLTWHLVDSTYSPWEWYNDTIQTLDSRGWAGYAGEWSTAALILPERITNAPLMKFRIIFQSNEYGNGVGFAFDDFSVKVAPPDIGITSIMGFADACQGINPDAVTVSISNFGLNTLAKNDKIIAAFDVNNERVVIDTVLLNSDLPPGQSMVYRFSEGADIYNPGDYTLSAYTLLENNPWLYGDNNDTTTISFSVFPNPLTSLPDTIQTHIPDTVVLKTIYNSDYDYWWNGTPGNQTYNVSKDGWQRLVVTATRGNGCTAYDSVNVELLFNDAGVVELLHPVDDCGFTNRENPMVIIKNFGTDSIYAGQKIAVTYSINGGAGVRDTLVLNKALHSGKTINFTFSGGKADLSQKGIYNFKVYTSFGGDTIASNDTIFKPVEILGRPVVSLGPDITVQALTHTLNAGSGFENYEWDNGETNQTRIINESGIYWVKVWDENSCDNSDTSYIRLKIRDVRPTGFMSPLSGCDFNEAVPVTIRLVNSGTDTVPASGSLEVSYRLNQGSRVTETIELMDELIPGAQITRTLNGTVDLSNEGDYTIEATVSVAGDLRLDNDTIVNEIFRYNRPVVDFGKDATEYVEDVSVVLDAGFHPGYYYQWHDTSWHESIFTATESGKCKVKVTDTRTGCFNSDSVMIVLIYGDVGITLTNLPDEACAGDYKVRVRVTNLGPSQIGKDAPIYVACDVDAVRVTIDTLTKSAALNPGASLDLDFSKAISLKQGTSTISFYTLFDQDKKGNNDTLEMTFTALPVPVIDFGDQNGNLTVDLPYTLDAGAGYQSYVWQDNSTQQTFTVNQKGTYSVTVTGTNDCQASKTVHINMETAADEKILPQLILYPNPNNGIFRINIGEIDGDITLRILNNSGQIVYIQSFEGSQINNEPVDVQNLPRGVYHLLLQTHDGVMRGKIIIE